MKVVHLAKAVAIVWLSHTLAHGAAAGEFKVRSADGVEISGEADSKTPRPAAAVIFVPGTGGFDRDASFGDSGTPRDLVFKDLAARMLARGIATVRYDLRGIRYGVPRDQIFDRKLLAARTTQNMRDDVAAVYAWARSPGGLGARCIVFFAHSEGMLHVARLAESGAPPPVLIIGMGAGMQSPSALVRWQIMGRDGDSLEMMDTNRDGIVTNEEVRANIFRTPSGVHGKVEPFLHPSGAWTVKDIAQLRATQAVTYDRERRDALAHADTDPHPNADDAFASFEWWKSWFLDDKPTGTRLASWAVPLSLHYGDRDSQTPAAGQIASAREHVPAGRLRAKVHAERGHTLGPDVTLGPMDEKIADEIAEEAAAVAGTCR
jgi:hypothetical protein